MKQLTLFGGSGRTGRQFLEQALEKGYSIKALMRQPENSMFNTPI